MAGVVGTVTQFTGSGTAEFGGAFTIDADADAVVIVITGYANGSVVIDEANWADNDALDFTLIASSTYDAGEVDFQAFVMFSDDANWPGTGAQTLTLQGPSNINDGANVSVFCVGGIDITQGVLDSDASLVVQGSSSSLTLSGIGAQDISFIAANDFDAGAPTVNGSGQTAIAEYGLFNSYSLSVGYEIGETTLNASGSDIGLIAFAFANESSGASITADQDEAGDTQSASLEVLASLSADQAETGDTTAASIDVVVQISANQSESGDTQAASLTGVVTAEITADQTEEGDSTAAALNALVSLSANQTDSGDVNSASISVVAQLSVSQTEDGDATTASLVGVVTASITASQTETGDITVAALEAVAQLTVSQTESGDTQKARILPPDYTETVFTVDYAGLHPDSHMAGDSNYADIVIGDAIVYEIQTPENGHTVTITGDGQTLLSPTTLVAPQTVDFYIWDASDETLGDPGTLTIEPAAGIAVSANQTEDGDTTSAALQVVAQVSVDQSEDGDDTAAAIEALIQLTVSQAEEGDVTSAAFLSEVTASLAASQAEEGDAASASLQTLVGIAAIQTEDGDTCSALLQVTVQLSADQAEAGDATTASIVEELVANLSVSQDEEGDITTASIVVVAYEPYVPPRRNRKIRFTSRHRKLKLSRRIR